MACAAVGQCTGALDIVAELLLLLLLLLLLHTN